MRILVFSDIHGDLAALGRLVDIDADYYIAAGDLVSWAQGLDAVGPILQRRAPRVYVLPGNHEHASHIEAFCEKYSLHPLHGRSFEAGGWHIAGLGHSNPTPFNTPGEYSESEITARLQPFAALKPLVLVCHCPPLGTALDRAGAGLHFGSGAIAEFLAIHSPAHFLCGHIHEAAGMEVQIGATRGVNVGKKGYLLELGPAEPPR
jgi:Icc-related predicted phosphoesterase